MNDGDVQSDAVGAGPRRWWVAALLTIPLPGLGHLYAGRLARAGFAYVSWLAAGVIGAATVAYLSVEHVNAVVGFGVIFGWWVLLAIDAAVTAGRRGESTRQWFQRWWIYLAAFVLGGIGYQLFGAVEKRIWLEAFIMPTEAMADTLVPGDRFLIDHTWYWFRPIERGDVVTFHAEDVIFVQRVMALPGDHVTFEDEQLIINSRPVNEPYAVLRGRKPHLSMVTPLTVPPGHVFLLGDNRRRSMDGRFRGTTSMDDITGRAMTIYWSSVPEPRPHAGRGLVGPGDDPGTIRWSRIGQVIR